METKEMVADLLQEAIQAASTVIPLPYTAEPPSIVDAPLIQPEMGVLIGITGHIRGRLLLESTTPVFNAIGNGMFGMPLEGEMLESFAGELGNMIGGTISTGVSAKGISIDITPPTVLV
jgi:chemotaxis protein CheX